MKKLDILQFQISQINLEIQKYQNQINQLQSQIDAMDQFVKDHPLPDELLNLWIRDLNMTTRTKNALLRNGIWQIRDIRYYIYNDMLQFNNFGQTCLSEVKRFMERLGVEIRQEE